MSNESVLNVGWGTLSRQVEERVMSKLHNDLATWSNDLGMRQMFVQDAADSLAVCKLIAKGQWAPVEKRLWEMDTAARDCVYDFIEAVVGRDYLDAIRMG